MVRTLAVWSPAAARCIEAVTKLDQRVVATAGHEQWVGLPTRSGTVAVERTAAGALPS